MSETNPTPERLLEDPRDRFYNFAEDLFGRLQPEQMAIRLLAKETERKTALRLDDKRTVELVSVFEDPEGAEEVNDQYSVFLNTTIVPGQVKREGFTIDASAYERKKKGEGVDPVDLMLMTADSGRSKDYEIAAEMQLSALLDEIEIAQTESWHALSSDQAAA